MLVSCRVVCGITVLRKYGLVDVDNEKTILEAYGMLRNGSLQTGDNFVVPLEFSNHAVTVNVWMFDTLFNKQLSQDNCVQCSCHS